MGIFVPRFYGKIATAGIKPLSLDYATWGLWVMWVSTVYSPFLPVLALWFDQAECMQVTSVKQIIF